MPAGMHHPSCVIFLLNLESEAMQVEEDGDEDEDDLEDFSIDLAGPPASINAARL
jgi:hypothetical protein